MALQRSDANRVWKLPLGTPAKPCKTCGQPVAFVHHKKGNGKKRWLCLDVRSAQERPNGQAPLAPWHVCWSGSGQLLKEPT